MSLPNLTWRPGPDGAQAGAENAANLCGVALVALCVGVGSCLSYGLQHKLGSVPSEGPAKGFAVYSSKRISAAGAATSAPKIDSVLPNEFERLSADAAVKANSSIPFAPGPIVPARPFLIRGVGEQDKARALYCLTQAVYYEAGFEPTKGREAVAQVVLNRVRSPAYPKTICGVVFQGSELRTGCQFTFTCDGSLNRPPALIAWRQAEIIAERALDGFVMKAVGNATHYHTQWVLPYWAPSLVKVVQIGAHIFYRWPGAIGPGTGLDSAYQGREILPGATITKAALLTMAPGQSEASTSQKESESAPDADVNSRQQDVVVLPTQAVPALDKSAPELPVLESPHSSDAVARRGHLPVPAGW